jgi:hypothetical protein
MKSLDFTTHNAVLMAKSLRCLLTLRCFLPSLLIAELRLADPFFFLETFRPALRSAFSLLRRWRGLGTVAPLLERQKVIQPNVDTYSLTCWINFLCPFYVDAKLDVVAISPTDNPNSLASRQEHRSASCQNRLI